MRVESYEWRSGWKIENGSFNNQKNGIYDIEHLNSRNRNAMKNHYLLTKAAVEWKRRMNGISAKNERMGSYAYEMCTTPIYFGLNVEKAYKVQFGGVWVHL